MAWQYSEMIQKTPIPEPLTFPTPFPNPAPISVLNSQISSIVPAAQAYQPSATSTSILEKKVILKGSHAFAPAHAPPAVHRAVAAGNRLQRFPYRMGGGHAKLNDTAYDCSGSVSYILREAGLLAGQMPSTGFISYGESGLGEWITIWAKSGHVYMTIGGLRLDTGGSPKSNGPRWKPQTRSSNGFLPSHPPGL